MAIRTEITDIGLNLWKLFKNVKKCPIKIQTVGLVRQSDARAYSPNSITKCDLLLVKTQYSSHAFVNKMNFRITRWLNANGRTVCASFLLALLTLYASISRSGYAFRNGGFLCTVCLPVNMR